MNITRSAALVLLALAFITPARAEGWSIDQLMHLLQQTRTAHAHFVEKKSIAMLEEPVTSSGELFYTAPNRLEKRTLEPKPESMLLDGNTLVIEQGRKKHVLQLARYPEIAAFIDSIRGALAGDRAALERSYTLSLSGTEESWALQLEPKAEKVKKVLTRIRIAGARDALHSIAIDQADGDSSFMTITPLSAQ